MIDAQFLLLVSITFSLCIYCASFSTENILIQILKFYEIFGSLPILYTGILGRARLKFTNYNSVLSN